MKSVKNIIMIGGLIALGSLSSCKKKCTIEVDETKSYYSQNFHIIDPDLGFFNDGDTTKARLVIDNFDVLSYLNLTRITDENSARKQSPGIYKTVMNDNKEVDVPMDLIVLDQFAMREESQAQAKEPLIACVERFDLYISAADAPPFGGHGYSDHYKTTERLLATYEVKDSSISVGPWGSGELAPFEFETNKLNLSPFLFENPISYFEIIATFKKVPDDKRVFSYNFALSYNGSKEGKCK